MRCDGTPTTMWPCGAHMARVMTQAHEKCREKMCARRVTCARKRATHTKRDTDSERGAAVCVCPCACAIMPSCGGARRRRCHLPLCNVVSCCLCSAHPRWRSVQPPSNKHAGFSAGLNRQHRRPGWPAAAATSVAAPSPASPPHTACRGPCPRPTCFGPAALPQKA